MGDLIIQGCNFAFGWLERFRRYLHRTPVETIDTKALQELLETSSSFVLIDARSAGEQRVSTLPGAITCAEYEKHADAWSNREVVVVYCAVGGRSYLYARKLVARGVRAKNYRAGIIGWCRAGLPLTTPQGTVTHDVHPYWNCFHLPSQYVIKR